MLTPSFAACIMGVLLCVDGKAKLVLLARWDIKFLAEALAFFFAAFYAGGGTVVSCGEDAFVLYYYCTDAAVFFIAAGHFAIVFVRSIKRLSHLSIFIDTPFLIVFY